jgi:hypothetical protein
VAKFQSGKLVVIDADHCGHICLLVTSDSNSQARLKEALCNYAAHYGVDFLLRNTDEPLYLIIDYSVGVGKLVPAFESQLQSTDEWTRELEAKAS